MQYILPTSKFEELANPDNWNRLLEIGIDEIYLLGIIISHLRLNGQIELDGSIHVPGHISLEHELKHGSLYHIHDDLRERFLYTKTISPVRELLSSVAHYTALLFNSLGGLLVDMIKSLQLRRKYELAGINLKIYSKVYQGILVDITYQPVPELRGYQYVTT